MLLEEADAELAAITGDANNTANPVSAAAVTKKVVPIDLIDAFFISFSPLDMLRQDLSGSPGVLL